MTSQPRFFIADQALRSMTGHYFEYDVSVAAHVPEPYMPVIIANSEAEPEVLSRAAAFFRCDFWGPTAARRTARPTGRMDTEAGTLGQGQARWKHNYRRGTARVRMLTRQLATQTNLLPALQWARRRMAQADAAGRAGLIAAGNNPALARTSHGPAELNGNDRELKAIFLEDLRALFQSYAMTTGDVLFFPNMNHWTLAALAELRKFVAPSRWPAMKLLFRRNIGGGPAESPAGPESAYWIRALRASFEQLAEGIGEGKLDFYTDTARLQAEYAQVSQAAFAVLPIPFRHDYIKMKTSVPETFQIAYFGEARLEKGFGYLPALVDQFRAERESGQVRFVFQAVPAPEPAVLAAIQRLRKQVGVTLLERPLSDREYYALLNASDVALLLYDPERYASRSSCIFVESVVSATPCITFAGSWMASVMEPGTGQVVETASQIPTALRAILGGYRGYQEAIVRCCPRWRSYHNPGQLVALLLQRATEAMPVLEGGA